MVINERGVNEPMSANQLVNEELKQTMYQLGQRARAASRILAGASAAQKNGALQAIADSLEDRRDVLAEANQQDIHRGRERGLSQAFLDRLNLNEKRLTAMIQGVRDIIALPDPVGEMTDLRMRPSGIQVGKMRVPLGVIGIIYESRPNVTVDAAVLCLKSGNATILRGGSEALQSNLAIAQSVHEGLRAVGLPADSIQMVETADREAVGVMLGMADSIDVIIPRGGKGLIERVSRESRIPVIKHLDGICHVYIDCDADPDKAHAVTMNSKTQRYGTCNTLETLLIHRAQASKILPILAHDLEAKGVELRGCSESRSLIPSMKQATEADWRTEYLAPILAVRIVDDLDMAIDHINAFGSHHTDSIITENYTAARRFLREVDSSSVMVNASTRFADGFEYGLGAEIGISTDKLHVRGPVGLEGLTTQKFIVLGDGQVRQ